MREYLSDFTCFSNEAFYLVMRDSWFRSTIYSKTYSFRECSLFTWGGGKICRWKLHIPPSSADKIYIYPRCWDSFELAAFAALFFRKSKNVIPWHPSSFPKIPMGGSLITKTIRENFYCPHPLQMINGWLLKCRSIYTAFICHALSKQGHIISLKSLISKFWSLDSSGNLIRLVAFL